MSAIPTTIESALAVAGEYRAGGTDLQQRLRSGVTIAWNPLNWSDR